MVCSLEVVKLDTETNGDSSVWCLTTTSSCILYLILKHHYVSRRTSRLHDLLNGAKSGGCNYEEEQDIKHF